jgi:HEAT repeat protein
LLHLALHESDAEIRLSALSSLGAIGDERSVEPVIVMFNDKEERIRNETAEVLKRYGSDRTIESLLRALHAGNYNRTCIANLLGEWRDSRAIESLCHLLNDDDWFTREAAIRALGGIGDSRTVGNLVKMMARKDTNHTFNIILSLGMIGGTQAGDALLGLMEHSSGDVRFHAAKSLGQMREARAVKLLTRALSDPYVQVRCEASLSLLKIGHADALEDLHQALSDPIDFVQASVALALCHIGGAKSIAPTARLLENPNPCVRQWAAITLGMLGDRRAFDQIVYALRWRPADIYFPDYEEWLRDQAGVTPYWLAGFREMEASRIRLMAVKAIASVGDSRTRELLLPSLQDPDPVVRQAAVEVLKGYQA